MVAERTDRREFLAASGLSLASAVWLAACGGDDGGEAPAGDGTGPVRWSLWANEGEQKLYSRFVQQYNAKAGGSRVELVTVPDYNNYTPKILTELNGGNGPDVFYLAPVEVRKFIDNGTLADLTPRLEASSELEIGDFVDNFWGPAQTSDGKLYGLPPSAIGTHLWYNKRVLREAGVTEDPADLYERGEWKWDVFRSMLDRVRRRDRYGFTHQAWLYSWVTGNGGKVYDGGRWVAHEDPKAVEAFEWMLDNVRAERFTWAGSLSQGQSESGLFIADQIAFVAAGRWYLPVFSENRNLEYDIVPWPTNTENKIETNQTGGAYIVMNQRARDPQAAFRFMQAWCSRDGQTFQVSRFGNGVPSIKGLDDLILETRVPEHRNLFLEARDTADLFATEQILPDLQTDVFEVLEPLFLNGGDVPQALRKIADTVNPKLEQAGVSA